MKKSFLGFALVALAFSVFAEPATIVSVKGKVEVERDSEWIPLNPGDTVEESEMVSTGFQSEAIVKYNDSVLQLAPLTRVTLSKLASNSNRDVVDVYLNTGAVRAKVTHSDIKKVNYSVRNPIAVASVRGTEFTFQDNGTTVCMEGAVAVAPARFYKNEVAQAESIDEIEEPEDGESDATTEATDVDPYSPAGSTVVAQGQATTIAADGFTTSAFATAIAQVSVAASSVQTAADTETVSASTAVSSVAAAAPTTVPAEVPVVIPVPIPDPTPTTGDVTISISLPGSLDINVVFED